MCGRTRQFVGARAYLNQWGTVLRVTWTSVFSNMAEIEAETQLVATKNRLACGKLMSRQILTRFPPDKKLQLYYKKLASVRQPIWSRNVPHVVLRTQLYPLLKCKYFSFSHVHKTDAILVYMYLSYLITTWICGNTRLVIYAPWKSDQTLYLLPACKFRSLASLLYSTYG